MVWYLFGKFATFLDPRRFLPVTFLLLVLLHFLFLFLFFQRCTTCQLVCTEEAATPGCRLAVQLPRPPHTRPRPPHWAWPPARHRAWASTHQVSSGQILRCCFFNREKNRRTTMQSQAQGRPQIQKVHPLCLTFCIGFQIPYFMWLVAWIFIR